MKIIHINYDIFAMDCDGELFTFADNSFGGCIHIKHCFIVNSAFLLRFCE